MPVNQLVLMNVSCMLQPKDKLLGLNEHYGALPKQLAQQTIGIFNSVACSVHIDKKQTYTDLLSASKNMQLTIYAKTTKKLETERLDREKAASKLMYQSEKSLAKHEQLLSAASRQKMLSALANISVSLESNLNASLSAPFDPSNSDTPNKDLNDETDQYLKESAELNTAATSVAIRRKTIRIKKPIQDALQKNTTVLIAAAKQKRKSWHSVNIYA